MQPIRIKNLPAWRIQLNVIDALFRREISTRFGAYKLGLLWLIVEPLAAVILLGIILTPIMPRDASSEVPYAFFILCGFMILKVLTGPMSIATGAITSNQGLLVFRQVQPIDTFIARFLFELFSTLFAFIIFCVVALYLDIPLSLNNLITLLACFVITWLMGCGLGLWLGISALKTREIEKVNSFIQRPLLFCSCVLFSLNSMNPEIQKWLLFNPVSHTAEISRQALFPSYQVPHVNLVFPSICAICCLASGLTTYRNNYHFLRLR
jgi:capsular polysaccharide transport system permease protein